MPSRARPSLGHAHSAGQVVLPPLLLARLLRRRQRLVSAAIARAPWIAARRIRFIAALAMLKRCRRIVPPNRPRHVRGRGSGGARRASSSLEDGYMAVRDSETAGRERRPSQPAASCPGPRERLRAPRTLSTSARSPKRGGGPAGPTTRRVPRRGRAKRAPASGPRSPGLDRRGRPSLMATAIDGQFPPQGPMPPV